MKFFEETWKTSQQQTKFKNVKFYMNHPKSFKKCSVTYEMFESFNVFQPGKKSATLEVCKIVIKKICTRIWIKKLLMAFF